MSASRSVGWVTAVLMAWVAVGCCCVPAGAASPSRRACCAAIGTQDRSPCPAGERPRDGCPLVGLRQTMLRPTPFVPPVNVDAARPLVDWLTPPRAVPVVTAVVAPARVAVATGPPTLLGLHTSLVE